MLWDRALPYQERAVLHQEWVRQVLAAASQRMVCRQAGVSGWPGLCFAVQVYCERKRFRGVSRSPWSLTWESHIPLTAAVVQAGAA